MRLAALLPVTTLALVLSTEGEARALGPIDLEAGLRGGFATQPNSGQNPLGVGLGARAGVGVFGLYAGLSGMYYLGESTTVLGVDSSVSTTLLGAEIGYTISSIPVLRLRPQLGIGNATFGFEGAGITTSDSYLYLEPGLFAFVPVGLIYVGVDANALIIPSVEQTPAAKETYTSFTFHAQFGIRL